MSRATTETITRLILRAKREAYSQTSFVPEAKARRGVKWPLDCTIGPGLEGAIACESKVGYVNGSQGRLIYRGYDIFDLCANSTFEEVSYLLLHGRLPHRGQLDTFKRQLVRHRHVLPTKRLLMGFPVEEMNAMAALRLGTNLMRHEFTSLDQAAAQPDTADAIGSDEDSIPMEVKPYGEPHAKYEFRGASRGRHTREARIKDAVDLEACYRLIAGTASLAAAIVRLRQGHLPLEPDPTLGHAANFLYMMTGRRPSPMEERVMDVALILHADHGMNASTFAAMVVASTLSDFYFAIGSGIAALNGPLHGGANEQVIKTLTAIGSADGARDWCRRTLARKQKIMGFGHRVYKVYDPRARVLAPLAGQLSKTNKAVQPLFATAQALEQEVLRTIGREKKIFPNVDFYSGLVYASLGLPTLAFPLVFAVSRVAGWTARVREYLENNRIFRPRAWYVGEFDKQYVPLAQRRDNRKGRGYAGGQGLSPVGGYGVSQTRAR